MEQSIEKRKQERIDLLKYKKELQNARNVLKEMSGIEVLEFYEKDTPNRIQILMKKSSRARTSAYEEPYSRCKGKDWEELYVWIITDMKLQEGQIFYFWCNGFWAKIKITDLRKAVVSLWEHDSYAQTVKSGTSYGFLLIDEEMDCIMEVGGDSRDEDNYLMDIRDYSGFHTEEEFYIEEQRKLAARIDLHNCVDLSRLKYVAGVDLAYWKEGDMEYAVCCIVVIDFQTREIIEKKHVMGRIEVPYIPGCLAFREIELVMETIRLLENRVSLYVFDGNGYLHPRHMGLATHAGILLGMPTIGVAKSYYKVENTPYEEPENEAFAYKDIVIHNEVYGRVVRTHQNVRPIFLSIGNLIDLDTATEVIKSLVTKESHIPMPTRCADIMTHEMRKEYQKYEGTD